MCINSLNLCVKRNLLAGAFPSFMESSFSHHASGQTTATGWEQMLFSFPEKGEPGGDPRQGADRLSHCVTHVSVAQ